MNCDVSKVESIKERINKARAFKEAHKSHLKQSYTPWCTDCRQQYKDSTCKQVEKDGKRIREWNDSLKYIENLEVNERVQEKAHEKVIKEVID